MTVSRVAAVAAGLAFLAGVSMPARAGNPRADWGLAPIPSDAARPWLGIIVTEIQSTGAEDPGRAPGIVIARVAPGSPAESAGLRAGDILLGIDDVVMASPDSLMMAVRGKPSGSRLVASVLREAKVVNIPVVLGVQPAGWEDVRRVVARVAPGDALPAREVDDVLLQFAGRHERASLGIETTDLEPGLARYFGAAVGEGVLVSRVEPASAAASAGLRAGDVLLAIGDKPVSSGASLSDILRSLTPGGKTTVAFLRDGARQSVAATMEGRNVPVWTAEPEGAERGESLARLAEHHRREASRLEEMLRALEAGNSDVAAYVRQTPEGEAAPPHRDAAQEIAALRKELESLKVQLRELEARIGSPVPDGTTAPEEAPKSRPPGGRR